ncbi:putative RDD family membrane protein YckC [Knoellia remsis]|uniref:Putative RDD family membrane protein YckC n=1 Tax=Knoellia remsis TaxID=407159 RepID=A0A2T0UZ26_9MICO|nr:RDD family protein [Knoellia remsis]PRY63185.1 putative RDD family membrane protein YckC [Knoellia remsis]
MSNPSSPGWYENPDNPDELRYFDGILWTSNTTPLRTRQHQGPVTPPAEGASTPMAPTPSGQPPQNPYGQPGQQGQQPPPNPYGQPGQQNPYGQPPQGQWGQQPGHNPYGQPPQVPQRPSPTAKVPGQPELASYGLRVVAYLVDLIVVGFLSLIFGGYFLWQALAPVAERLNSAMASNDFQAMSQAVAEMELRWLAAFIAVQLLVFLAYHVFSLTRWGATPGKRMVGISVRRIDRPGPLDTDTAVRRAGFQAVLQAFGNLPYLSTFATIALITDVIWPIPDDLNQSLHDKVAKTIVVRGKATRDPRG